MAKGNMLLGQARGSVGDVVFSVENGEQIAKVRARTHANPKTQPQQIQRAIMATVAQAWVVLGPIIKSMWQGYKKESEAKFKFTSINISRLRSMYAADEQRIDEPFLNRCHCVASDASYCVGNEYQIAQGTLTNNQLTYSRVNKIAQLAFPAPRENDTVKKYGNRLKLAKSDRYTIVMLWQLSEETFQLFEEDNNEFSTCHRWRAGFITLKPREDYKKNTHQIQEIGDLFEIVESYNVDSEIEEWEITSPINAHTLNARGLAGAASVGLAKWRYRSNKRAPGWLWLDLDPDAVGNWYAPFGLVHPYILKAWSEKPTNIINPSSRRPQPTPTPTHRTASLRNSSGIKYIVNEAGQLCNIGTGKPTFMTYFGGQWVAISPEDPSALIEEFGGLENCRCRWSFDGIVLAHAELTLAEKDGMEATQYICTNDVWTPTIEDWQP